ncbi:MAG: GlmU family protein [Ignavibacteria bacterium]|nr:GlmU family protein [Ignavibacteria bacterium]
MAQSICIYENSNYQWLLPLVYTRPQFDLRCGILTLREKIMHAYPGTNTVLHCRPYLAPLLRQQIPGSLVNEFPEDSYLFINGALLATPAFSALVPPEGPDMLYISNGTVVAARLSGSNLKQVTNNLPEAFAPEHFPSGLEKVEIEATVIVYPWNLVGRNGAEIAADFTLLADRARPAGMIHPGAMLLNPDMIYIAEGAQVKPGVIIDAEEGPVYIGPNAQIMPQATIIGPAAIGANSVIKIGAKIYENTSIGPVCKVGGEVEGSIIHSYSNKQHDGFLGHAYLGSWVNLGADTNNSDLKNNYSSVRVTINDQEINSGSMFVGLTMGDHSKSAINTMFNTGTVVGMSSNIFGPGFPKKYIPSYAWGGSENLQTYSLEKAIEVAKKVMARRKIQFTDADELVFRTVYSLTENEREKRGMAISKTE